MSIAELESRQVAVVGGQGGLWSDALRRLRRNPGAIVGFVLVALFVFVALFAPFLAPDNPRVQDLSLIDKGCCPGPSEGCKKPKLSPGYSVKKPRTTMPGCARSWSNCCACSSGFW